MNRQMFNAMVAQCATPKVSGDGLVSWEGGKKCVIPSVKLYGAAVQDGTPTPEAPAMPVCNNGVFRVTNADGTYDGGQAQAPELWAIPGTEFRDEWDPQTGRGIRRVQKVELGGSEMLDYFISDGNIATFNATLPANATGSTIINLRSIGNMTSAARISDVSTAAWRHCAYTRYMKVSVDATVAGKTADEVRAWLAEQYSKKTPLTVWCELVSPEPFYSPPAKLTMPTGYGQIIQISGDVPDCPITAKYLTHS